MLSTCHVSLLIGSREQHLDPPTATHTGKSLVGVQPALTSILAQTATITGRERGGGDKGVCHPVFLEHIRWWTLQRLCAFVLH